MTNTYLYKEQYFKEIKGRWLVSYDKQLLSVKSRVIYTAALL